MSRTLYVSDMDGTLLGRDSQLSSETVALLNRIINEHHALFTVATARTPATVAPLMQQVNATLPYIVIGGAAMWDSRTGEYRALRAIDNDTVSRVADAFEQCNMHPFVYRRVGKLLMTHHWGPMTQQERQFIEERRHLPLKRMVLDDPDYRHSAGEALLIFAQDDYDRLRDIRDAVSHLEGCTVTLYHDIFDQRIGYFEVHSAGTSKASTIARLAREAGADRVVVFGDNRNDLPMMQAATLGIAVANAMDEVKVKADLVIGPNTEDSVPRWILDDLRR